MSYYPESDRDPANNPIVLTPMTSPTELLARLYDGVPVIGMHEDNSTELFDVGGADETMHEAAALIEALIAREAVLREALEEIIMLLRATDRLKADGFADQAARLASEALTDGGKEQ